MAYSWILSNPPGLVRARPDGLTCTVSDSRRGRQSGVWSCQGRFVRRLGLRSVPPASWGGTCCGWVRLLADERSHWTLTPARHQVATGFWVRSGTIPMGARQLVRQDGWQAAIFGGRNRPSLLMVAHQLASASRSSSAALTSLVALDSGTNLDSGAEGPTERTARSRKPIERDRNRSWSSRRRCPLLPLARVWLWWASRQS